MDNKLILTKAIVVSGVSTFDFACDENLIRYNSTLDKVGFFGKMDILGDNTVSTSGGVIRSSLISIALDTSSKSFSIDECIIFLSDDIGISVYGFTIDFITSREAYFRVIIDLPTLDEHDFRVRLEIYGIYEK